MADDIKVKITAEGKEFRSELKNSGKAVKEFGEAAEAGFKGASAAADLLPAKMAALASSFEGLKTAAMSFGAIMGAKHMADELIEAQVHAQQIKFTLEAAAGSAEGAAKEFAYVANTAQTLGVQLDLTAEAYGKFLISAKAANVNIATTRDLFQATAEAGTVFHLSQVKMHQAMLALEQMMAQGAIRTQELRLQLGQALPGVYENFMNLVKKRGVDFQSALEKGKLSVHEYSSVLADAIRMSFKPENVKAASEGLNSQLARMKNAIFLFKSDISGGFFEEAAAHTVKQLADVATGLQGVTKDYGPFVSVATVAGAALFAYSKAMNAVGDASLKFGMAVKEKVVAIMGERAALLQLAEQNAVAAAQAAAEADAKMARVRVLQLETQETIQLLTAKAALLKQEVATISAQAGEGAATQKLISKKQQLLAVERQLSASKVTLAKHTAAFTAATATSTKAGDALVASTTQLGTAQANAAKGFSLMGTALKGIKGLVGGAFNLMGGWPGLILAAVVGLKELHGWMGKAADEAERTSDALDKAATKLSKDGLSADTVSGLAKALEEAKAAEMELFKSREEHANIRDVAQSGWTKLANIFAPGSTNSIGRVLDDQITKEDKLLEIQRQKIDAYEKAIRIRKEELAVIDKLTAASEELGNMGRELSSIDKEITKNKAAAERIKAKNEGELAVAGDEMFHREKEATLAIETARATAAKAESEGRATVQSREQLALAEKNYLIFIEQNDLKSKALMDSIATLEAEKAKQAAHKKYLEQLKEQAALEKKLNASAAKLRVEQMKQDVDNQFLSPGEKTRQKAIIDANQQFIEDWQEISKLKGPKMVALAQERADVFLAQLRQIDQDGAEAARQELNESTEAFLESIRKAATGKAELEKYMQGLAASAGDVKAGDALAKGNFMDSTAEKLMGAGMSPMSPEFKTAMDDALVYFDQMQAKSKGLTNIYDDLAKSFEGFATALVDTDWVKAGTEGPAAVGRAFLEMIQQIVQEFIRTQVLKMIKSVSEPISGAGVTHPGGAALPQSTTSVFGAFDGSAIPGMAAGGKVTGPGGPKADKVPTMLSNGEFVMNTDAVNRYGVNFMEALNASKVGIANPLKLAQGGLVGSASSKPMGGTKVNVINATGQPVKTESGKGSEEEIVNVVLGRVADSVSRNGIVGQSFQNTFGVRRTPKK